VAGGAWDAEENVWRSADSRFLFGKDALAACFKGRFIRLSLLSVSPVAWYTAPHKG
jgi:hypothetical protein